MRSTSFELNANYLKNSYLKGILQEYNLLIRAKNLSIKGTGMYQACVKEFLLWLEKHQLFDLNKIKSSVMIDYYEYITNRSNKRREGKLSESSINLHLFSLRLLMKYLVETNQLKHSVTIPGVFAGIPAERETLDQEEIKAVFSNCHTQRETAILSMAYGCGLRRSEIEALNCHDIFLNAAYIVVRHGKNKKRRDITLSDFIINNLQEYIVNERPNYLRPRNYLENALIINNKGKRMNGGQMNLILKEIIKRTKNKVMIAKKITLHCLRHSLSMHLLENGADLEFIRELLGHSNIDTTYLYAIKNKRRQKLINRS